MTGNNHNLMELHDSQSYCSVTSEHFVTTVETYKSHQKGSCSHCITNHSNVGSAPCIVSTIADDTKTFTVEDNWGDTVELKAGELNDEARRVFLQGQCLGLATVLAEHFGTNQIAVEYVEAESEVLLFDAETQKLVLDEHGDPIPEMEKILFHAYAIDMNGNLWDVDGMVDYKTQQNMMTNAGRNLVQGDVTTLKQEFAGYLPNQDEIFATTMIPRILALQTS